MLVPRHLVLLLAGAVAACGQADPAPAAEPVPVAPEPPAAAAPVVEAVVAARETVESLVPSALQPTHIPNQWACAEQATALIVRWEVSSPSAYTRRWQGVIWPGGASGPTWAIGYDGGHQTRRTIAVDWRAHEQLPALETTSGVVGQTAKARVARGDYRAAITPFSYAVEVFTDASLPAYHAAARRAIGPAHFDALPCGAQAALVSCGYNRGWAMLGARNREKRVIRDECAPAGDTACIAVQLRSMKRLWPTVPGLQARRDDEARRAHPTHTGAAVQ